ncbi:MAG: hypothetical protein C5B44_03410 [Acidobacteria bacterium]|nr:MAG: hypothetical protein C5B44_03410 [Acidobacteriota bacterium]
MFLAGCRQHAIGARVGKTAYLLILFVAIAAVLPYASADFNDLFMVQATIMAGLFAAAYLALRKVEPRKERSPGVQVMSFALLLLSIDFLHYLPMFGARKGLWGITIPTGYLKFTSIFDLILEILLGFGTIMVLMESVRHEVERANGQLLRVRDRLELLAQMDPLTEALNRHAFHSLISENESGRVKNTSGSIAVIDIDNLKPINDTLGHPSGDKAIRAVATAIRSVIRADDMLFRWGGDEFLVLMFKLHVTDAGKRMQKLNSILVQNSNHWNSIPMRVTVSHGVAGFESLSALAQAIEHADKEMYRRKQELRRAGKQLEVVHLTD